LALSKVSVILPDVVTCEHEMPEILHHSSSSPEADAASGGSALIVTVTFGRFLMSSVTVQLWMDVLDAIVRDCPGGRHVLLPVEMVPSFHFNV
jgi:hypothetical protein